MRARVAIVGGGVMGVSIAWHLAARLDSHDEPVVLFEKKELAAGSSGRSGAILRQFYSDPEVAGMARDSLRVFRDFETRTGRGIGFLASGVLTLGTRANELESALIERNVAMMRSLGIAVELLDAAALRALVPSMRVDDDTLAAWEPDAGAVDPVRTVHAFAALAREHGAVTRLGARVEELVIERRRVRGVRVDGELVECDQLVVATGPWSRPLLARAGIEVPLQVVRPEQHFLALPGAPARAGDTSRGAKPASSSETSNIFEPAASIAHAAAAHADELLARFGSPSRGAPRAPHPVLLDLAHGFYARCDLERASTRVGRLDYHEDAPVLDPDRVDEHVSDEFRRWARTALGARMPEYERAPDAESFVGLYTLTPDSQAILGPLGDGDGPIEGLFVATGFSGHGFKLSPSIGEGMAQLVCGDPVSAFDARFFAPDRFRTTHTHTSGAFGL